MGADLLDIHSVLDDFKRRQRIIKLLIIVSIPLLIVSLIPEIIYLVYPTLILVGSLIIILLISYILNQNNKVEIASNLIIASITVTIFFQSLIVGTIGMSFCYFFAEMLGIPFIINKKKKKWLILHMVLVVIATVSVLLIDQSFLKIRATEDFDILNGPINVLVALFMIGFFVYFMIKDNDNKEEAIIEANDLLLNKNDFLEKTNQELDHLVYSISHDLRAPISSALGLIELSKIENEIEQLRYYDGLKEMCLKRLDSFIFDILNYLKNNRLQVNVEKLNIEEEIQFAIDMNRNSNEKMEICLEIQENVSYYSDRNRLRIIFNNLISNAIRYSNTKDDNASIKIKATYDDLDKAYVVKIEDNGIGIDEEYLPKIFDMFFKTDDKGKGSGLGLYITKEAVLKLNGSISVESEKGVGTTFKLVLPNLKSMASTID